MGLYSLLYYCHCIVICHASYVSVVVKEASREFREGTNDLYTSQDGGLELRVDARGSERGLRVYEEPFVESVPHA